MPPGGRLLATAARVNLADRPVADEDEPDHQDGHEPDASTRQHDKEHLGKRGGDAERKSCASKRRAGLLLSVDPRLGDSYRLGGGFIDS
jgi:hypothetical protein